MPRLSNGPSISTATPLGKPATGGVLHLPDALAGHVNNHVVLGVRVSPGGSYDWRSALHRQYQWCRGHVKKVGGRIVAIAGNDQPYSGKLCNGRPDLVQAAALCRSKDAILCYRNIPRLLRASALDATTNPLAVPTEGEFRELHRIVGEGIVIATIEPLFDTRELHSRAVKQGQERVRAEGKRIGRPSKIDDLLMEQILRLRQCGNGDEHDPWGWDKPLASFRQIARNLGFRSHAIVERALRKSVPAFEGIRGWEGTEWGELRYPYEAWIGLRDGDEKAPLCVLHTYPCSEVREV